MKPHIVITVEGGVIQSIMSDHPCECTVVDYDIQGADADGLTKIPQLNSEFNISGHEEAVVSKHHVDVAHPHHKIILDAIENSSKK